ncbi:MAG: hypothetical protein U0Y82_07785 [Thermoleophilia bacterium]
MTVLVIAVVVVLCAGLGVLIAWPLLRASVDVAPPSVDEARRASVDDDLRQTLASIREIEFDREAGHLSDADFATLDAQERARAVALLRERDRLAAGAENLPEATEPAVAADTSPTDP